jgi:hypothetical protein
MTSLDSFKEAFSTRTYSSWEFCDCGKEFGHPFLFEEITREDYETIRFNNREYVTACDCWKAGAEKIIKGLDANKTQIAEYFRLEKLRFARLEKETPVIEGG